MLRSALVLHCVDAVLTLPAPNGPSGSSWLLARSPNLLLIPALAFVSVTTIKVVVASISETTTMARSAEVEMVSARIMRDGTKGESGTRSTIRVLTP